MNEDDDEEDVFYLGSGIFNAITYCTICGAKLLYSKEYTRFDVFTGRPSTLTHIKKCPNHPNEYVVCKEELDG